MLLINLRINLMERTKNNSKVIIMNRRIGKERLTTEDWSRLQQCYFLFLQL